MFGDKMVTKRVSNNSEKQRIEKALITMEKRNIGNFRVLLIYAIEHHNRLNPSQEIS